MIQVLNEDENKFKAADRHLESWDTAHSVDFLAELSSDYFTLLQILVNKNKIAHEWDLDPNFIPCIFFSWPDYKPLKNQHALYNENSAHLSNSPSYTNYPFCT